ncbi:MAG: transposase domain-containing protein [Actinobacteria bacterium]|nr:transposase domain-containing protein [Actinomycetota bacterium]
MFARPVLTAPAFVKRDGTVLADAWLPDLARLGELEAHLGDGVIEDLVAEAAAAGWLPKRTRRRLMSFPLVIRLMVVMTLTPDASYCEALSRLAGLLADIPFTRDWHVPTAKVITDWRLPVPPGLMEALFWRAAGPLVAGDAASAVMLAGRPVAGADGMLVNVADTPANRAFFGTTGTGDGSSPFPQLRVVALIARAGRAMLGAVLGQASAGEQTLLKRLVKRRPDLFDGLVVCFDRNFPGHDLITAILDAGGHVIARVKAGIALPFEDSPGRGWLPDGSRMTWLNAPSGRKAGRLPVRAAEHNAVFPAGCGKEDVSETCTVITTLLDHAEATADQVREAYLTRWGADETPFGQDKATIAGAGKRTSGPVLRSGRPRLVIQEAWAWLTGTQLVRASAATSLTGSYAAARALRRKDARPVTADEESFTAAWHCAVRSMTATQVTATSSLDAIAAAGESAARACLRTLNVPGRHRHSDRKQKARPKFGHTAVTKKTFTGKPQVTVFAPGRY